MARPYHDSVEISIGAAPRVVWELIADVTRIGEWSPVCRSSAWISPATGPAVGARFIGYNRMSGLRWSRVCEVLVSEPGVEFAFQTVLGGRPSTVWRYLLSHNATRGTDVTEQYTVTSTSASPLWVKLVESLPGMHRRNRVATRTDMVQTLHCIKAAAEASGSDARPVENRGDRP